MTQLLAIEIPNEIRDLVSEQAFAAYGSNPATQMHASLAALTIDDLFPAGHRDKTMAACCLSGLWLLHNFLDDSHSISQDIKTPEGSYWHAIMHRHEGDFGNSKYWYRNVGMHPVYQTVSEATGANFDPAEFVERCESETDDGGLSEAARKIEIAEWKSLFEFCFRGATK